MNKRIKMKQDDNSEIDYTMTMAILCYFNTYMFAQSFETLFIESINEEQTQVLYRNPSSGRKTTVQIFFIIF